MQRKAPTNKHLKRTKNIFNNILIKMTKIIKIIQIIKMT
jgi:hypothetical protein